jgi:hypothetical protein
MAKTPTDGLSKTDGVDDLSAVDLLALTDASVQYGPTADRPTSTRRWDGKPYFDTTVKRLLSWNNTAAAWEIISNRPRVSVTKSGTQSIANNTNTAITFDGEDYDSDSIHSTSSNTSRLTIPTGADGVWRVTYTLYFAAVAAGTIRAGIAKNAGTDRYGRTYQTIQSSLDDGTLIGAADIKVAAGDYLELYVTHVNGSASARNVGPSSAPPPYDRFTAHYVGLG